MGSFSLLFESPPWLIAVGVLLGIAYAALLYYRSKTPWGKHTNYVLAIARFLLVAQITLLLFGPLIRQIKNTKEPPTIVLAIDNSQSIAEIEDSTSRVNVLTEILTTKQQLENAGYSTEIRTLHGALSIDKVQFDGNSSNLNRMLRDIQNDYESRNLAHTLLFSDGLYNQGSNPAFLPYNFKISAIGLGDSARRPDLNLNAVLYNKIAYQGNQFPIVAELFSYNLQGSLVSVQLEKGGGVLESQQIEVGSQSQFNEVQFLADAEESGMQRLTVRAVPLEGEFITSNNMKEAYVDVIDGKQKVLLIAAAPHPDIRAIKSSLEKNENYELVSYIDGINQYVDDKYDAVILHQVPSRRGNYQNLLQKIKTEGIPAFYIYGSQSDINAFNAINGMVRIMPISMQKDQVLPLFNTAFDAFIFEQENSAALNEFTPVSVPFANYALQNQAEVMLFQKVGKISTEKPLLIVQKSNGGTNAVMLGEGMWNWRIQEFARNQNHAVFDEMISKIIQYLSTKEDKRRFKVYTVKNEYLNSESVVFETEVYNAIYEPTYDHKINLQVTGDQGNATQYTYITSAQNSSYRISGLENGIYSFTASATVNGKNETINGSFTVRDLQIETTDLSADYALLRNIAKRNDGKFYLKSELDQLRDDLLAQEPVNKIYASESYLAIINLKWGFFILIALVGFEWFLRKYHGSY
jgi:hypothetical protein